MGGLIRGIRVEHLLKRMGEFCGNFEGQIKKDRHFHGQPVRGYRKYPDWTEVGRWNGGIKVRVVRHGK